MGRLEVETYEDGETVRYAYDNSGNLATVTDSATGVVTTYYYDLLNRQSGYREQGENYDHSVVYTYDAENNLSSVTEDINGVTKTYSYTYNEDNQLISETVDGITVEYTYDGFGRLDERVVKNGTTEIYSIEPSYSAGTGNNGSSTQIASYNGFTYTYDANGNILSVSDGIYTTSYVYDSANQLIKEINEAEGYAYTWEYDNAGNILRQKKFAYVNGRIAVQLEHIAYQYDDTTWGDLLTGRNWVSISYDKIGNPVNDGEWSYTWKHGRELASMSDGTSTWNYTYNADGLRTERTNGTDTYRYVYNGSSLAMMIKGNDTLSFSYDATGIPLAVTFNGTTYYYKTNLQGDVMGIVDSNGTTVVTYAYNAWGVLLACSGTMADTLGTLNPLRYRGYVYDTETGLYYLQSRYYNPEWGRFINGDCYNATGQGFTGNNMFAYCGNNPSVNQDCFGTFFERTASAGWGGGGGCWISGLSGDPGAAAAETAGLIVTVVTVTSPIAFPGLATDALRSETMSIRKGNGSEAKVEELERTIAITTTQKRDNPVYFPANPYDFNPIGLTLVYRPGSYNGPFISWMDPVLNIEVFRWDENISKDNGPHYHIFSKGHFYPGDKVPEPFASYYFPYQ